jgi:cell division protein YceG involved in septum cleavage
MNKSTQNILLAIVVFTVIWLTVVFWLYFPAFAGADFTNEYGWQRAQIKSGQDLQRHRMNMEIQEQTQELRRIRESLERRELNRSLKDSY